MDITVIGATGRTGSQVVTQALTAGHRVTALVRNPDRMGSPPAGDLSVITGDVRSADDLRPVVKGRDAVITTLGPRVRDPEPLISPALAALIAAMRAEGTSRVLLVSNSGMHTAGDPLLLRAVVKPILGLVLRRHYADAMRAEHLLRESGLDWTIARPPRLTNGPHRPYRTDAQRNVRGGGALSRADLADYLLRAAADDSTIGQAVSLGY